MITIGAPRLLIHLCSAAFCLLDFGGMIEISFTSSSKGSAYTNEDDNNNSTVMKSVDSRSRRSCIYQTIELNFVYFCMKRIRSSVHAVGIEALCRERATRPL